MADLLVTHPDAAVGLRPVEHLLRVGTRRANLGAIIATGDADRGLQSVKAEWPAGKADVTKRPYDMSTYADAIFDGASAYSAIAASADLAGARACLPRVESTAR